jgi:hypothetical protein
MEPHLWRVPTLFAVMACSALLLFAAGVIGSVVTRRRPSSTLRFGTVVVLVLLAVVCAVATRATAWQIARSQEISVVHVDPSFAGYLTPTVFAGFAFAVGRWMLNGAWTGRPALLFYAWLLGFTAANVVNRCSPGWCATVGFPLAWYSWSDSLVTLGNDRFDYLIDVFGDAFGAVVNLLTFVVVASLLTRGRVQPAKPATK